MPNHADSIRPLGRCYGSNLYEHLARRKRPLAGPSDIRGCGRERSKAMTLNEDDVVAWTFNGQRTSCTVRIARLMLGAAHHDWSDERIEQELLVRIEAEGQA
jgi:hypothetical protein